MNYLVALAPTAAIILSIAQVRKSFNNLRLDKNVTFQLTRARDSGPKGVFDIRLKKV